MVVFDRYINGSLKARTRRKRTSGKEIRYKILDSTNISSILVKSLLSHIDTKQDVTVYSAKKSKSGFEAVNQQFVVTYDRISESNIESFPDVIKTHGHEEADTLFILNCFSIATRDPFTTGTVYRDGLVVNSLDSQSRSPVFKTTGWLQGQLSLSSFRGG